MQCGTYAALRANPHKKWRYAPENTPDDFPSDCLVFSPCNCSLRGWELPRAVAHSEQRASRVNRSVVMVQE